MSSELKNFKMVLMVDLPSELSKTIDTLKGKPIKYNNHIIGRIVNAKHLGKNKIAINGVLNLSMKVILPLDERSTGISFDALYLDDMVDMINSY
jgi:hypothetical protein